MSVTIAQDDLSDGTIIALLNAHLQDMHNYSPPESIHALDTDKLRDPAVTFWGARIEGQLAGCGALKALSPTEAEIKSMKTDAAFLRRGVAAQLLSVILAEAQSRGYQQLWLETGSHEAFHPAIALYERAGFSECGPFADYVLDPYSRFFTKILTQN